MRSSSKGWVILVLILVAAATYCVWKHDQKERTRQAKDAEEKRLAALVKEMASLVECNHRLGGQLRAIQYDTDFYRRAGEGNC